MLDKRNVPIEVIIDEELVEFVFESSKDSEKIYTTKNGIALELNINQSLKCINAKRIDDVDLHLKETEIIIELFIDKYNEFINSYDDDLINGIESTRDDINLEPEILSPYDPNSIRVSQGRFSLKEIYEMINGNEYDEPILDLSPDFQRNYVWDSTRKSRLIESILLQIPLPVFYLARDNDGKYQVVDGVQRFSVINEFFANGFKLKDLEYLHVDCENKYFQKKESNSLHPKFTRHLRSYQIDCNIIEPGTPHRVKLDIFKRLNTGGRSLNNQEIRNSLLKLHVRDFIRRLSKSKEFIEATNNSIRSKRMADQELVLRYIGFYFIYKKTDIFSDLTYRGVMDEFLDDIVEILNNKVTKGLLKDLESDFYLSMKNASFLFGIYAFRKVDENYGMYYRNMINKSLFTAFSVLLSNYSNERITKCKNGVGSFAKWLSNDSYLYESITYGTNDKIRIDTTFLKLDEFLKSILGGTND